MKPKEIEEMHSEIHAYIRHQTLIVQERSIPPKNEFDVSKHVHMVPPFHKAEVDKYLLHFKK